LATAVAIVSLRSLLDHLQHDVGGQVFGGLHVAHLHEGVVVDLRVVGLVDRVDGVVVVLLRAADELPFGRDLFLGLRRRLRLSLLLRRTAGTGLIK